VFQPREAAKALLHGLRSLAEAREEGAGPHLERMSEYAGILAGNLPEATGDTERITPAILEDLCEICPLYDIGKMGIPNAILLKPAKLTPEEFEIIKTHATLGAETLRGLGLVKPHSGHSLVLLGIQIAESHHEKWDGTGYPKGLTGEAIPLAARIVALADVYDALTSRRCYRLAFFHNQARKIILDGRGKHFDPALVDCFLALEDRFLEIRRNCQGFASD
jgi:response regulator RpfG family c-di-GMP phosphodiesterase